MNLWKVTIEAWPFAPGEGETTTTMQMAAGPRSNNYAVRAVDIGDAMKLAEAIQTGIRANPAVWLAPITAIVKDN